MAGEYRPRRVGKWVAEMTNPLAQDLGGVVRLRKTLQVWRDMKQRCYNPRSRKFKNYGGRGISICPRWLESPELFIADMGLKPDGLTIDRINNDGNYEPSNCRWATKEQQGNNTRQCVYLELNGERMTVEAWAHKLGRHPETIRSRNVPEIKVFAHLSP